MTCTTIVRKPTPTTEANPPLAVSWKEPRVRLDNLAMPPWNATRMGVLHGLLRHFGLETSAPSVYGISGQAFLLNIHRELCPSGPYCWNHEPAEPLLRHLGIGSTVLGFVTSRSARSEREAVERQLCDALEEGRPCSLLNLEHQLIVGHDAKGFLLAQPWPDCADMAPARLSYGDWPEFGGECHALFTAHEALAPAERRTAVLAGLDYAIDLNRRPTRHAEDGYGIGPDGWANWLAAAEAQATSHGQWWNAMVWSESRRMAAAFFGEIAADFPACAETALELQSDFARVGEAIGRLRDKALSNADRRASLEEAAVVEARAIVKLTALAAALRSGDGKVGAGR